MRILTIKINSCRRCPYLEAKENNFECTFDIENIINFPINYNIDFIPDWCHLSVLVENNIRLLKL